MPTTLPPEVALSRLSDGLVRLQRALAGVDEEARTPDSAALAERLRNVTRQVVAARILGDEQLVAISGRQGVGKSSMVTRLLGLPEDLLTSDVGRGERLAVLIRPANQREHSALVHHLAEVDAGVAVLSTAIDLDDVGPRTSDPGDLDLFVEIRVPAEAVGIRGAAFLLLPGIEDERSEWSDLVRVALSTASACVFVVHPSGLTEEASRRTMDKVVKEQFGNKRSVVALTHGDVRASDFSAALEVLKEQLGTSATIVTTSANEGYQEGWTGKMWEALAQVVPPEREDRRLAIKATQTLLEASFPKVIDDVRRRAAELDAEEDVEKLRGPKQILDVLAEEWTAIRTSYKALILTAYGEQRETAHHAVKKSIADDSWWKKAGRNIWGEDLKHQVEFEEKVRHHWNAASPGPRAKLTAGVADIVAQRLDLRLVADGRAVLERYERRDSTKITETTGRDLAVLGGRGGQGASAEITRGFRESVRVLPALAIEYTRLAMTVPQLRPGPDGIPVAAADGTVVDEFKKTSATQREVIGLVGAFFVGDVADGKIDSVPGLVKALGIAGATHPAVLVATAALAVGAGAIAMNKKVFEQDVRRVGAAAAAFGAVEQHTVANEMRQFDAVKDRLDEVVKRRLSELYGVEVRWARRQSLHMALAEVREAASELRASLAGAVVGLG